MALQSNLSIAVDATHTATAPTVDLGTGSAASAVIDLDQALTLAHGTGAGQADRLYSAQRTLAASANETLDLAGVLTDAFGATITFARIKAFYIVADAGNANNVIIGDATSNAWAALLNADGTITLRPGGWIGGGCGSLDATGWVVTATTGDLLKVANSGAGSAVTYDIVLIGCSA